MPPAPAARVPAADGSSAIIDATDCVQVCAVSSPSAAIAAPASSAAAWPPWGSQRTLVAQQLERQIRPSWVRRDLMRGHEEDGYAVICVGVCADSGSARFGSRVVFTVWRKDADLAGGVSEVGRLSNKGEGAGPLGQISLLVIAILAEAAGFCADRLEMNATGQGTQQIHAQ